MKFGPKRPTELGSESFSGKTNPSSPSNGYTAFTQVTKGSVVDDVAEEMYQSSSPETYRAPMV
jgi:hypothetical protein